MKKQTEECDGTDGVNEEELAGSAFVTGEVNWWSGKEELKNLSKPTKPGNTPCRKHFAGESKLVE